MTSPTTSAATNNENDASVGSRPDDGQLQLERLKSRKHLLDKKYIHERTSESIKHPGKSTIEVFLREELDEKLRSETFPCVYDLGNLKDGSGKGELAHFRDILPGLREATTGKRGDSDSQISKDDFKTIFKGIRDIAGKSVDAGKNKFPLTNLKVIKLLWIFIKGLPADRSIYAEHTSHLFGLIGLPDKEEKFSFEYRDVLPDPRNDQKTRLIIDLMARISAEISDQRYWLINKINPVLPERLQRINYTNQQIVLAIRRRHNYDPDAIANALRKLTHAIDDYQVEDRETSNPLDESIYTHLRNLRFMHYAHAFGMNIEKAKIKGTINHVLLPLKDLCFLAGKRSADINPLEADIDPLEPTLSLGQFDDFCNQWQPQIITLIVQATNIEVKTEDFPLLKNHAQKLLHLHCFRFTGKLTFEEKLLSVADCIGALCTIHNEWHQPIKYYPHRHGWRDTERSLLTQFDSKRSIEDQFEEDYVPQGVNFILYHRWVMTCWSLLVPEGTEDDRSALREFQAARLKKYAQCLKSNDATIIHTATTRFDIFCANEAEICFDAMRASPVLHTAMMKYINEGRSTIDSSE